ncbi:MAG: hypothetical protein OXU28_05265 [Chloroflexota bacterium]|nr:hypothetical protein [Chloroflexota bacterium]
MPHAIAEYHAPSIDFLIENGPHIQVLVAERPTVALLDSGSRLSYVDIELAEDLGAPETGAHTVRSATGQENLPSFGLSLRIPVLDLSLGPPLPGVPLRKQGHFWQVIVGRDVLSAYLMTIDWRTGLIRLS